MERKDKIKGTLYGQALGDAMGMPAELWSREKTKNILGEIKGFLDGPKDNTVACNYTAGQFTDDTGQALVILDSLYQTGFEPDGHVTALNILKWAEEQNAFDCNILGPTSKAALQLIKEGKGARSVAETALSNGAAMRIAPVGCLFEMEEQKQLAKYVCSISRETHESDITIASAAMIAAAVSAAVSCSDTKKAVEKALEIESYARSLGKETFSPSIRARVEFGIEYAERYKGDERAFLNFVYDVIGAGVPACQSVPAALLVAYYAEEPDRCALLCANLGGDTDTIGAMATAICGAAKGFSGISEEYVKVLTEKNNVDWDRYVEIIENGWKKLHG